ncbi:MAG TPA: L-threonylcarbamoyladenylate synthase [Xanthobacteraceae bacterium]|nr:L-threonylcarbamoyladenylate synthase [Xanthobacteraceae bacterium]
MSENLATRLAPANEEALHEAAAVLKDGGLVAFPTETVYGLGADATNSTAIAKLYAAKGRPAFNPLIAHVNDIDAACALARFDRIAEKLAEEFWPGPLTLVLPKTEACIVAELATAGLNTIAVRIPHHPIARAILTALGKPVAAPSANRSGHVSPTTARHVLDDLSGAVDLIVDGGAAHVGVESTIVGCLGGDPVLLRPGGISRDAIARVLGRPLTEGADMTGEPHKPLAPGMLASHYAPRAVLRLDATSVNPGEALLAFGHVPAGFQPSSMLNLSERGDVVEAAANLFAHLRALDSGVAAIAVMPVPNAGLGEAINDRLRRAAAPRM